MSEIRAIETRFKGYRFRSRLEARWAVFFDALGIRWEYEPQGFHVGWPCHTDECAVNGTSCCTCGEKGRPYLPDFLLPGTETWVEVKGDVRSFDRSLLAHAVDWGMGLPGTDWSTGTARGLLLLGSIPQATRNFWPAHPILQHSKGGWVEITKFFDGTVLPTAGEHRYYFDSTSDGLNDPTAWGEVSRFWRDELGFNGFCPDTVINAYAAARSARFEHGETPR